MKQEKIIIYQIFTRLFSNRNTTCKPDGTLQENGCGKMNDIDSAVLSNIRKLGVTHVWYTGIIRHATQTDYSAYGIPRQHDVVVKGKAGSPYAITDYYDVDPDLAVNVDKRMDELQDLIRRTHQAGLKAIIDFVPNHVAREYKSICKPEGIKDLGENDDPTKHFSTANNFYYCWGQPLDLSNIVSQTANPYNEFPAKATGNDQFSNKPTPNDWYETVKLNYGIDYCDAGGRSEHFDPIPDTWNKMTDILLFWAQKGVDGFRCDMAEMVPAAFWAWATDKVKYRYPEKIFVGEVYDPNQYDRYIGAGFDYLYDKVGMYDCLRDVICGMRPAADITRQWQTTDRLRPHMLYFLENHDEQRIASSFFAGEAMKAIPAVYVSVLLYSNPFMLYAGQEFGEAGMDEEGFSGKDGRTTIFDYWCVPSLMRGYFDRRRMKKSERSLMTIYQNILNMAINEKAIREGDSFDLMYVNPQLAEQQFAFIRKADDEMILVVANFGSFDVATSVVVPSHAFTHLMIPEMETTAVDLVTKEQMKVVLRPDKPLPITIGALSARVYKFMINHK